MGEWLKHRNWTVIIWLAVVLLIFLNVYAADRLLSSRSTSTSLQITVLDVGQGDSILVRSPDGQYGLIDGGRGDVVLSQLSKFMLPWERQFAFVIATHPDADHIEGLSSVLERYGVQNVFWEQNNKSNSVITKLHDIVEQQAIPNFELTDKDDFKLGCCVDFDVIWPQQGFDTFSQTESNNVSLTVIIRYKHFQMFSGGDLPMAEEEQAISALPPEDQKVDVLKVSHHGSKNSTSAKFLGMIDAQIGLISVGAHNTYGHPTQEVLDNLKAANMQVFRTDLDGPIQLSTDGDTMQIKTANQLENLQLKD